MVINGVNVTDLFVKAGQLPDRRWLGLVYTTMQGIEVTVWKAEASTEFWQPSLDAATEAANTMGYKWAHNPGPGWYEGFDATVEYLKRKAAAV